MAIRIRASGEILCAAMYPAEPGDTYIDDSIHYVLSVDLRVLRPLPHGAWEFGQRGCHDLDDAEACALHNAHASRAGEAIAPKARLRAECLYEMDAAKLAAPALVDAVAWAEATDEALNDAAAQALRAGAKP